MLLRVFPLAFFLIVSATVLAQQKIRITTLTKNGEPVPFSTIILKSAKDSSRSFTRVADSTGTVSLVLTPGSYSLRANAINYKTVSRTIQVGQQEQVFRLEMEPESASLQGVVVTARRPLMRQEDDKTIVDPENIVLGSTNAYEVMERIPGLFVDQDGNIYLNSTTPSQIWINGREQRMSAADVATILKSLPPNSIQSIEIIRSPSARYDASGGGGIVNVILKKNVKLGLTGSFNAGISQGRYGNQFAGFNINNGDGKMNSYLNLNISNRNSFERIKTDRTFAPDSVLFQDSYTKYPGQSAFIGFGFSYQFNRKWEFAYDSRINLNIARNENTNPSEIRVVSKDELISANNAFIENDARSTNISQGFNLKYRMDSLGSEWSNDLSYSYAPYRNDQDIATFFTEPQNAVITAIGDFDNSSHFLTFQSNLIKKFKSKFTLESGIKTSNVWFDNTTRYFNTTNGSSTPDRLRTNSYQYDEHIHAVYAQVSKPIGGFILKTGVRVENTNMNGRQLVPTDTSFSIKRTDAFPYAYLSRNLMKIAGYDLRAYLVYRRSIARPSYSLLNPAIRIVDPYLVETGDPTLKPQFTQNYEANISVDERPIFAVGVNDTKDIFSQVVYQADSNKNVAVRTYDNVGRNRETYFRLLGALPPGKKYFFVAGVQYNHNNYEGQYEGEPLLFKRGSWSAFTYHNYRLTPNTQISLNGFYRWKGQLQFYELGNFGNLNINISQQLLKKKLTLTAGVTDVFYTNWNTFFIQQGTLTAEGFRKADTRRFTFNLRYNFGIRKKDERKDMFQEPGEN